MYKMSRKLKTETSFEDTETSFEDTVNHRQKGTSVPKNHQ